MTKIAITAEKSTLHTFTKKIKEYLDSEIENSTTKTVWKEKWLKWKDEGFAGDRKLSRYLLAKLVLGQETKDKSITNIINGIRTSFPPIDDHFTFTPTANDTDLWYMTISDTRKDKPDTDKNLKETIPDSGGWSTVPVTDKRNNPVPDPVKPVNDHDEIKNKNRFDSLASSLEEDVNLDISYGTSTDDSTKRNIPDDLEIDKNKSEHKVNKLTATDSDSDDSNIDNTNDHPTNLGNQLRHDVWLRTNLNTQ